MDLLAPFSRKIIAPLWATWERSLYLRHYNCMLRTQFDSPKQIKVKQETLLKSIITHAYRTTQFWKERLETAGIHPDEVNQLADLSRLPLLTKNDLRAHGERMVSSAYNKAELHLKRTSGSTGVPVQVYVDDDAGQFKRGATLRADEWSGWRLGDRKAIIWGNPAGELRMHTWRGRLRNRLLERTVFLDCLDADETSFENFAILLRKLQPKLLFGHAHSLYLFARYLQSHGPEDIRPRGIISAAMVLHDWERQTIEDVFQCPVTNRYGCEEVSLIACECERHNGLHINSDGIAVEILRPDGTAANPGEPGMIIVTDLVNHAMPIIRYKIGDMGSLADHTCPCGRGLPLLNDIQGRVADYIVTPDGKYVSGISLTDHFNTKIPGVVQMQIIQEEIDRFVFRIVKDTEFGPASQKKIHGLVSEHFGEGVRYECEFVNRIPQEASGKYRFCISKVDKVFEHVQ
ncbi:MAG: phenylacetate--CoA ligase family protein [Pirellulales bacterium]|nr:phenylacetate--CoA ligase family protein [Pirellulales bacterium]